MPAIYAVTNINTYPRGNMYFLTEETADWVRIDMRVRTDYEIEFAVKKKYVKKDSPAMKQAEKTEKHYYPIMIKEHELGYWIAMQMKIWRMGKLEACKVAKLEESVMSDLLSAFEQYCQECRV